MADAPVPIQPAVGPLKHIPWQSTEFRRIWTGGWLEVWQKQTDAFVPSQNVRIYWITVHSHVTLLAVSCQVLLLWFNNWTLAMTGLLCLFGVCSLFLRVSSCWCGTSGWVPTAFRSKPGFWQTQQAGLDHTSIPTASRDKKGWKAGRGLFKAAMRSSNDPTPESVFRDLLWGLCSRVKKCPRASHPAHGCISVIISPVAALSLFYSVCKMT